MSKTIYIGNASGKASKVKNIYVGGADRKAHKVKYGYIGDANGVARCFYAAEHLFTIPSTTNQTIYIYCNGGTYTSSFNAPDGQTWSSKVSPATGYIAGTLTPSSGTISGAVSPTISAATPIPTDTIAAEVTYWNTYGASSYSWETSDSGRKFARGKKGACVIMQWDDNGTTRNTLILGAKYRRAGLTFYSQNHATQLISSPTFRKTGYFSSTGSSTSLPATASNFTDASLNGTTMAAQDTRSSKAATDTFANCGYYGSSLESIWYVRNTLVTTTGVLQTCDLPTINCLTRIYGDMTKIDDLDITATTYSNFALTTWLTTNRYSAWSSSYFGKGDFNAYYPLAVNYQGKVAASEYQTLTGAVIPVVEL